MHLYTSSKYRYATLFKPSSACQCPSVKIRPSLLTWKTIFKKLLKWVGTGPSSGKRLSCVPLGLVPLTGNESHRFPKGEHLPPGVYRSADFSGKELNHPILTRHPQVGTDWAAPPSRSWQSPGCLLLAVTGPAAQAAVENKRV